MISCISGVMCGLTSRGGAGLFSRRSFMMAKGLGPENGVSPESISYNITPDEYKSLRPSPRLLFWRDIVGSPHHRRKLSESQTPRAGFGRDAKIDQFDAAFIIY